MKKLNNNEIDVVVNEIVNNVKEIKLSKIKEVLEVDSNYKEIVSKTKDKFQSMSFIPGDTFSEMVSRKNDS